MKKLLMIIMVVVILTSCDFEFLSKNDFDDYDKFLEISKSLKNKSKVVVIDVVEEMKVEDVKNVNINLTFEKLSIITEKRDTIKIHYFGLFSTDKSNGPDIEFKTKSTFSLNINNRDNFSQSKAMTILYLPEDYKGDLEIHLASGNIDMEDILAKDIYISLTSGNVNFKNIKSEDLIVSLTSGNIEGDNIESKKVEFSGASGNVDVEFIKGDSLNIGFTSGNVNFKNIKSEDLIVSLTSGNIEGDNIESKKVEFSGTSGNIDIEFIKGDSLNIGFTSGNYYVKKLYMQDTKVNISSGNINFKEIKGNVNIDATSGKINVGLPNIPNYNIDLSVKSGNILFALELDEIEVDNEDRLLGTLGSGKYELNIETSSGDITIE